MKVIRICCYNVNILSNLINHLRYIIIICLSTIIMSSQNNIVKVKTTNSAKKESLRSSPQEDK